MKEDTVTRFELVEVVGVDITILIVNSTDLLPTIAGSVGGGVGADCLEHVSS